MYFLEGSSQSRRLGTLVFRQPQRCCTGEFHAVPSLLLSTIEGLVGGLNDLLGLPVASAGFGYADTHGHREMIRLMGAGLLFARLFALVQRELTAPSRLAQSSNRRFLFRTSSAIGLARAKIIRHLVFFLHRFAGGFSGILCPSIRSAYMKRRALDDPPQRFKMLDGLLGGSVAEDDRELFAAAAEGLSIAAYIGEALGHHAQHLVADVVPVGIVEIFEMVDIDDGDGVLLVERKQGLVEGAASANAGEFVVVGEHIDRKST